jgi:hypothetical protein
VVNPNYTGRQQTNYKKTNMQEFYKGDKALYEVETGKFWQVKVKEVKSAYGHVRYVVTPVGGGDEIATQRLTPLTKEQTNEKR